MENIGNNINKKDFLDLMFKIIVDEDKEMKFQLIRHLKERYIDLQPSVVTGFNLLTPETIHQLTIKDIVGLYQEIDTTISYIHRGDIKTAILSLNNIPYKTSMILREREKEDQGKVKTYA